MTTKTLAHAFCAVLAVAVASGCHRAELQAAESASNADKLAKAAEGATKAEEQWEYLVVSFGKTGFADISEGIKSGRSKLGAFRDFAERLGGSEAVTTQEKLDILGRFGWELISVIGAVGGDQQMLLKRQRREDRLAKEQEALRMLATILKRESAQREKALKAFLEELAKEALEQVKDGEVVELDSQERKQRENAAQTQGKQKLLGLLPSQKAILREGVSITTIDITISSGESWFGARKMRTTGKVKIEFDASGALLRKNGYRASEAQQLADSLLSEILSKIGSQDVTNPFEGNLEIELGVYLVFNGKRVDVETRSEKKKFAF